MRLIIKTSFFLLIFLALIAYMVSVFVQPILPPNANTLLVIAVAAILGAATFLASLDPISRFVERYILHRYKLDDYRYQYFDKTSEYSPKILNLIKMIVENF